MPLTIAFPELTTDMVILDDRAEFLRGKNIKSGYSQFGECGLIDSALVRIGAANRFCFEVGAADGVFMSNTKHLIDKGWASLQIEGDADHFAKLQSLHRGNPGVRCENKTIGRHDLDDLLTQAGAPSYPDVGVIDVDGSDYEVWKYLMVHRPRLMLVEFAPECYNTSQAKGEAIVELGIFKRYIPLAATYCNVLFCKEGVL